jgi:hypothetical protein
VQFKEGARLVTKLKPLKKIKKLKKKAVTKTNKSSLAMPMNEERDWRAQDDARTLKQSMEIRNDPARLKAAQGHVTKEMEALKMVTKMKG